MTQEVKVMVGVPASGKSTFVKQEVKRLEEELRTTCVISRDYIRAQMLQSGEDYFSREDEVFNEFIRQINEAMELGIEVVFVDATHINKPSRRKLLSRLIPDPHTNLTFEVMRVPVATALERNAKREGFSRVPDSAILKMAKSFSIPNLEKEIPRNKYGFNSVKVVVHNEGED